MISSIFGKTKPINYIIILTILFVFYWYAYFFLLSLPLNIDKIAEQFVVVAILLFMVFVINFIVKRNKITGTHSYAMLFFALLVLLFPEIITDNNSIICSFFLLLATRRLLSIKSLKNIKLKLLDATIWIVVSSIFYDWAILFLLLVFITIYLYEPKNIRNWLVPFIGVGTVVLITLGIVVLTKQDQFFDHHFNFLIGISADYIFEWSKSIRLILYILTTFIAIVITFVKLSKAGQGRVNTMRLITIFFFIGLIINLIKTSNEIAPIIITFFPAAIFMTNYIETIKKPKLRELALIIAMLIPILVLLANYF